MLRKTKPASSRRRKKLLLESFEERILCAAQPDVSLTGPATGNDIKIGQNVDVTVRFDNVDPADTGYGPYADVFIKTTGADGAGVQTDDGLSLVSATFLGTPVTTTTLTFDANGQATHPYARTATGASLVVDLVALGLFSNDGNPNNDTFGPGDQMLVFQLPFGSTTPQQPAFDINMQLAVSNLADVGTALPIYARGGFQFGNDALDNPTTDPSIVDPSFNILNINPTIFTVTKYYTGYENTHTANITPGQAHGEIPTGPNFTQTYRIEVDIAAGQTISALNVRDILQNNMQFAAITRVQNSAGTNLGFTTTGSTTSTTVPGGTMQVNLNNPITGGTGTNDVVIEFSWFVPRIDSTGAVIINATTGGDNNPGDDILTNNNVRADGTWTPLDVRDPLTAVSANDTVTIEGIVSAESLSVQKGATIVTDVGAVGLSPGDVVEWTMTVEVSDYFAYNNLILSDVMSDGHRIDTSFLPTFSFGEHDNLSAASAFAAANWDVSQNFTGAVAGVPAANFPSFTLDPAGNTGTTSITWRISNEMVTRGFNSNLTGGGIDSEDTGLAGAPRNNPPMPWGGTTATVRFRTVVQDVYSDDFPSGEPALDQGDGISNSVVVSGDNLNVAAGANLAPTGTNESDDGGASLTVQFQALQKTIYAINGNTNLAGVNYIRPGDSVTYRIQYTIPTGDIENFLLTDYLPLPVFNTNDFDITWNAGAPADASVPAANTAKRGPNDTFVAVSGNNPTIAEPGGNSVSFNYGTYSDPTNTARTIDVLFTVVVNSQPFADALFLTNQAVEVNNSTGNVLNTTTAIQQIRLGEPVVGIFKGVVGANGVGFTVGGIQFNGPGGGTGFIGTLDSAADAAAIGGSNVTGLDAQDTVRFAVVVQNTGHSDAFDVALTDTIPAGYVIPATLAAANFTVRRGDGTLLVDGADYTSAYSNVTGTWSVTLTDNYNVAPLIGALNRGVDDAEAAITNGSNGIIITYDVSIAQTTQTGSTITNTATLTNYTNIEGGTDFTVTNPTENAAVGLVAPSIAKTFIGTEFNTTGNNNTQAVIGEFVTYTVTVTVPEGTTSPTTILDTLDAGLAFFEVTNVIASGGLAFAGGGLPTVSTAPANTTIGGTGQTVQFNLGTITNSNSSNGAAETITITYRAIVRNVVGNQGGTNLNNSANLTTLTTNVTSSAANIAVVEPALTVVTQASANNVTYVDQLTGVDALDTVYYRVRIQNAGGGATAFEMALNEVLPATTFISGMTIFSVTDSSGTFNAADFELVGGNTVRTLGGVPSAKDVAAGTTIDIVVQGTLTTAVQAAQILTTTGTIQWSSLDGTVTNRSTNNNTTEDEERTGTGGVNDYTVADAGSIRIDPVVPVKTLVSTTEASTTGSNVVVGETARFRLAIQIPEGTQTNVMLQDFIPAGLQFLDNGNARVAYIADTAGTYSNPAGATLALAITDAYRIPGSTVVTPTFTPTDAQVGSTNSITADPDGFVAGTDAFFKFGTIVNNDSDGNAEYLVVEFDAIVSDVGGNTAGATVQNGFQLMLNGTLVDSPATVNLTVLEPRLQITKTANDTTPDINQTVTFTLTVTHPAGTANDTTAFDIRVRDVLPAGMTFNVGSVAVVGATVASNASAGTTLDLTLDELAVGGTATITFTALVNNTLANVGATFDNNARIFWDSLPADEANNSVFNNAADGTPDRDYGAIFGNVEVFNAATDPAQDTERLVVNANTIAGVAYDDRNGNGTYDVGTDLPIGNVQMQLTGTTASGLVFSQTVNTNVVTGAYQFINIPDGANYTITETQPATYLDARESVGTLFGGTVNNTTENNTITGISVPANASQNATGYNFGEVLPGSIAGTVYVDANDNGALTAGEAGISNVTVVLTGTDIFGRAVTQNFLTQLGGAYSFTNLLAGNYTVTETQPTAFDTRTDTVGSLGGSAAIANILSGIVVNSANTGTGYNFGELVADGICAAIGDDGGGNGGDDLLILFTAGSPAYAIGLGTGTNNIETGSFDHERQRFLAVDAGLFGTVDLNTGLFSAIGTGLGSGNGSLGNITINDMDGIAVDPFNADIVYGAIRRGGNDLLVRINTVTGTLVQDAFGLDEYVVIPAPAADPTLTDIDDMSIDPTDGRLFAVANDGGAGDRLVVINRTTGAIEADLGAFNIADVEGLSFDSAGVLHATTGAGATHHIVDKTNAQAGAGQDLTPAEDVESVDCRIDVPNTLSGRVFFDQNTNQLQNLPQDNGQAGVTVRLWRDVDGSGTVNAGDIQVSSRVTDGSGDYDFSIAALGQFVVDMDTTTLPVGASLTTDNIETANFTAMGQNDPGNDFAFTLPGTISGSVYRDFDNDGVRDGGETGIGGVNVRLQGTDYLNNAVDVTISTSVVDGTYTFTGVLPGTYSVTETAQPVGLLDGRDTAGTPLGGVAGNETITAITMIGAGVGVDYNFGELPPASISGVVYADFNNNGVLNAGETRIPNVTITLTGTDDLGAVNLITVTDTNGAYTFGNLRPGTYALTEGQPAGYNDGLETTTSAANNQLSAPNSAGTAGNDTYTGITFLTVAPGNNAGANYNFGEIPAFSATKTLESTNQTATTGSNTAIGEVVRFRLVAGIPVGTYNDVVLAERIPAGLQFLNNGTAAVSLVSSTGALLTSSTIVGAGALAVGTPTTLLADAAISNSLAGNVDTYGSGTDVYFRLGNLTNNDTDLDEEFVVIEFDALVVNEFGNQSGTALANTFAILADTDNSGAATDTPLETLLTSGASTLTVVEPRLALDKTVTPTTGLDAGDAVTYTITLTNLAVNGATATAFDTLITDVIPAGVLITSIDSVNFPISVTQDAAVAITGGGTGLSGQFDIPVDATVTITYTGILQTAVTPTTDFTNTATATFSSINGADANERGGTPPNLQGDGSVNDYRLVDTAILSTTNTFQLDKTSAAGPFSVGDTVAYTLTLTVFEGTTNGVQIADILPAGFQFTAGSVVVTPGAGMSSGYVNEATSVTVVGQNVTFNLGTTINPANGGNTFTITFDALVLDTAANAAATAVGQTKTNTATATGTGVPPSLDTRDVQFVEPRLVVTKAVSDTTPDINDVLTYTVNVAHAANSGATAYDIRVRDLLPAGLDLDELTLTITSAPGTTTINAGSNLSAGNLIDFTLNQLGLGETVTFTYQARVVNALGTVGTTQDNNVRLYWDSQAADEPTNTVFSGGNDLTSDRDYGATPGYTELDTPAPDDAAQDTVRITVNTNSIAGTVYRDNDSNGTFSAGDTRLNGVEVRLTGTTNSGLTVDMTFNTVNGDYSFAGLAAGNYVLTETQPAGHTDGLETVGTDFGGFVFNTVGSNVINGITIGNQTSTAATGYNFGETLAASLAGQVYRDFSNDGTVNPGELGINNVTVTLTGTDIYGVAVNETLVTAGDGNYLFNSIGGIVEGLRPGNYTITETADPDLAPYFDGIDTPGTAGGTLGGVAPQFDILNVTLAQNTAGTAYNFGELDPASISGFVFSDTSNDGIFDPGTESGINNVQVRLTGTDDLGAPVSITVTTPISGAYSFTGLRPGNYTVTEVAQPPGYTDGTDAIGTGLAGGGNNIGTLGNDVLSNINIVNVAPGNNAGVNYNFGEIFSVELTKTVVGSSEAFTGPVAGTERVAIGEIVRYRVVVQAPEAAYADFTIRDTLPAGMRFINDGSTTLALVSNGNLTSSFGFGGSQVIGSSSNVTPTFVMPGANISSDIDNTADAYGSGGTVYFHLGNVVNTDTDGDAEYYVIEFNAQVLNETGNQSGTTLGNTFDVLYDSSGNGIAENTEVQLSLAAPTNVVVAESNLAISKALTAGPAVPDAGDQLTYRITLTNNAAGNNATTAFNVRILDILDALTAQNTGVDLELINTTLGSGITITAPGGTTLTTNTSTTSQLDLIFDQLAAGESLTVDIVTRVITAAPAGSTLTNSVTSSFTSLPGTGNGITVGAVTTAPGAAGTVDGERTGGDVAAPTDNTPPANNAVLNNYAVGATIPLGDVRTTDTPTIDKTFTGTSEAGTLGTNVAIGETVTFTITITVPEGTTQGVIVTDNMQPGLEFIGATVGFAGSGVAPFVLPAPGVTGDSGIGTQLVYNIGNITNADDNNAANDSFTITVTARVADLPGNVSGVVRGNNAGLQFTDPDGPGTGVPTVEAVTDPNGDPQVTIVEPQLQIAKSVDDTTPDINQVVTYTLVIDHRALASTSDAYDVRIRDLIPHDAGAGLGLILNAASITVNGVAAGASGRVTANATAGDQLDLTLDTVAVGETITITYQARVENTLANVGTLTALNNYDNNARIYWDSLAGDEATNAVLDVAADNTPDRDYGATPGVTEAHDGAVDPAQDGVRVTVNTNTITGVVYRDENVNGVFNDGVDERLNNVTVRLTGTTDSGLAVDITTQTVNGNYEFTALPSGTYVITETQPVGLTDGVESIGTNFGGTVSDVLNADTITAITIPAQSATTGISYNFGEVTPSSIAGSVYHDLDNDAFRDALEIGLASEIRLTGTDAYGQAVDTTIAVTDGAGDGRFLFNNLGNGLRPGAYTLTQTVQPATYLDGRETAGTSGGIADSLTSIISAVPLGQGINATDYLFGEVLPSSLAGTVYVDASNDGVLDAGETRIGGVTITLTGTDDRGNGVNTTAITLPDGTYSFVGLRPGNYTLTETQPAAYNDGLDANGNLGGTVGNDIISNITTTSGDIGTGYNFGERPTGISGTVFSDLDRAGDLDLADDTGIGSVTINLRDNLGTIIATTTTLPDGTYQFTGIAAGDYTIEEVQPLGYGSSTLNTLAVTVPIGGLTNQNFGETLSTIGGIVFQDNANDGILNGTDTGLSGVTIRLTGTDANGATVDRTTTTGVGGVYSFGDLLSGTYRIRETQPISYVDGIDSLGSFGGTLANDDISAITVPVGVDGTNYNFAERLPTPPPGQGAIRGIVFRDADRDGILELGDTGLGNVTLELLDAGGNVVATTVTAGDGRYSFTDLDPGTYSVRETQPAGYGSSTPNLIGSIVVPANTTITDQNFGETTSGLSGKVFTDLDRDGVFTIGEPGISGVTLTLTGVDVNGNGVTATTITDANGDYAFDGLVGGTYRIVEAQPADRIDGLDAVGTSGGTAQNDILTNVALAADTLATGYNFGELLPNISGTVYRDDNRGGTLDGTEPGIGNVTLTLRDNLGNIVATTTTDGNGAYEFRNVMPGIYTITETQPAGYGSSSPNVLNVPVATADIANQNFGETTGSLAGTVYRDVTAPNTLTAGDIGLGGVLVTITGTDAQGSIINRTISTNADGTYLFDGLLGGTYFITETQPTGFTDGAETVGTAGGDGNTNDVFADIGLGDGIDATGYNFGETITPPPGQGAVTGTVWLDRDRDGLLEAGENGIVGVQIELLDGIGTVVATGTTGPDGRFVINGIAPGTYSVRETQPAGYGSSTVNLIGNVTVVADGIAENNNFGETLGSLAGTVYRDLNNNGTQEVGETGIGGVTLTLTGFDTNNVAVSRTAITNANGDYVFEDLLASDLVGYTVTETQPAAFNDGLDAVGSAGTTTGNDILTGAQITIVGDAVTDATEYNFGELGTTLSGNVWVDRDRDGIREPGTEPNGLANVLITLLDANGDLVATTTTNAAGDYSFTGLAAGDYTIVQTQPNGYGSSTLNVVNATVPLVGLTDQNFGETPATIGGRVFSDFNQDGIENGPDRGIPGTIVRLVGTDATGATVNLLTSTDANGDYQFIDLLAGNYTLIESQPGDFNDGADIVGSVGGLNLINDRVSSIGLGAAVDATDYDFAEIFRFEPVKTIVNTSNPGTTGSNLSIGEVVRFRLVVAIPDGGLTDVVLAEFLPRGLVFLNDGTAAVAFVSGTGNAVTSTTIAGPGLGATDLSVRPSVLLTDAQISASLTDNEDNYGSGTDVYFRLGNLENTEINVGDPDREYIVLEFNARAGNEPANQLGRTMDNTFAPRFDLTGDNISDPLPPNIVSPEVRTIVAEPVLSLDKQITAGPKQPKPGDLLTFTVTIRHAAGSNATAWEALFNDTLPSGMTVVNITTKASGGAVISKNATASGLAISGQFDIPVGGEITITYQVRVGATVKPGTTLTNGAGIVWTSLPGDQPTERTGKDSLLGEGGLNDYGLKASVGIKVVAPPPVQTGIPFFFDGFNNFADFGRDNDPSPFPVIPGDNDIYRMPLLPLAPMYSGEADPGATITITLYNANGENIGSQTIVVDAGGNWMATFPSVIIRDYPNTVEMTQLNSWVSMGSGVGYNLRTYFSPALNAGHFFYETLLVADDRDTAPLLSDLQMANPLNSGSVKYHGEVLAGQAVARGY